VPVPNFDSEEEDNEPEAEDNESEEDGNESEEEANDSDEEVNQRAPVSEDEEGMTLEGLGLKFASIAASHQLPRAGATAMWSLMTSNADVIIQHHLRERLVSAPVPCFRTFQRKLLRSIAVNVWLEVQYVNVQTGMAT
jgi:cobalamin biosynthesis protein CobT